MDVIRATTTAPAVLGDREGTRNVRRDRKRLDQYRSHDRLVQEAPVSSSSESRPATGGAGETIRSLIPARIDRLNWAPFHTRMVIALGTSWVLDGLEIPTAGSIGAVLNQAETLALSSTEVGAIATVYLLGKVFGALLFGRLSDALA